MEDPIIKAIVFDFGNVIAFFDHRRATTRLAAYSDLSSEAIYGRLFGGELEENYESGRLTTAEYVKSVRELCRLCCSDEELAAAYSDIFWPNEGVCALLPRLKPRYRLLVGSNTTELHALRFRQQFADVLRHFDDLVLSYQIGVRKPQPAFFGHCQGLAGCAAEACLFIDDTPGNVEGAIACGWRGIVYTGFDALCQRLRELRVQL